jgi:hypothetical protein
MYSLRILSPKLGESTNIYLGSQYTVELQKNDGSLATRLDFDYIDVYDENECVISVTKDYSAYIVMKDGGTYECLIKA